MSNPKSTLAAALICAAGLAAVAAPAAAMPLTPALALKNAAESAAPGAVETVRYWGHGGWGGRGWGYGGWRGRGWGWGAPFVAGAVIGGALAAPYYYGPGYGAYYGAPYPAPPPAYYEGGPAGDDVGYCQQRFRSYDPSTGTYLGFDGARHPCP
jgi:BA14K-like protein